MNLGGGRPHRYSRKPTDLKALEQHGTWFAVLLIFHCPRPCRWEEISDCYPLPLWRTQFPWCDVKRQNRPRWTHLSIPWHCVRQSCSAALFCSLIFLFLVLFVYLLADCWFSCCQEVVEALDMTSVRHRTCRSDLTHTGKNEKQLTVVTMLTGLYTWTLWKCDVSSSVSSGNRIDATWLCDLRSTD